MLSGIISPLFLDGSYYQQQLFTTQSDTSAKKKKEEKSVRALRNLSVLLSYLVSLCHCPSGWPAQPSLAKILFFLTRWPCQPLTHYICQSQFLQVCTGPSVLKLSFVPTDLAKTDCISIHYLSLALCNQIKIDTQNYKNLKLCFKIKLCLGIWCWMPHSNHLSRCYDLEFYCKISFTFASLQTI